VNVDGAIQCVFALHLKGMSKCIRMSGNCRLETQGFDQVNFESLVRCRTQWQVPVDQEEASRSRKCGLKYPATPRAKETSQGEYIHPRIPIVFDSLLFDYQYIHLCGLSEA